MVCLQTSITITHTCAWSQATRRDSANIKNAGGDSSLVLRCSCKHGSGGQFTGLTLGIDDIIKIFLAVGYQKRLARRISTQWRTPIISTVISSDVIVSITIIVIFGVIAVAGHDSAAVPVRKLDINRWRAQWRSELGA